MNTRVYSKYMVSLVASLILLSVLVGSVLAATGETARVSVDSAGVQGNGTSGLASISADGRYVAFVSWANNLVSGDTNGMVDVFMHETCDLPAWDVNKDGEVSLLDLTTVGSHWGETGTPGWIRADVNRDGVISVLDLTMIGAHWGEVY